MKRIFLVTLFHCFPIITAIAQPISLKSFEETSLTFRTTTIDCDRAKVIENYTKDYLGTSVTTTELGWNGNIENCEEGSISELAMERTLRRINYFRNLVGLDHDVIFDEVKNQKCQKAVLMMDAENKLDHYPTEDWKCSSEDGIQAAGKSNLSYGGHSSASVPQYIRDAGSANGAVGHRRWILYPKAHEFGFGSTNWGTAMWVIGGNQNPDIYPDFVAYPSPGHFPKNLIYPRWSFSKKGATFNEAKIKMYNESDELIGYSVEEIANGYGDNTLVWIPDINLYDETLGSDIYIKVEIDSIKSGGEYLTYDYEVLGIVPEDLNESVTYSLPSCGNSTGSISLEVTTGYRKITWSTNEENSTSISGLSAGEYSVTITDKIGCESTMHFSLQDSNEPKELSQINGNLTPFSMQNELYKTDQYIDGNYFWTITNGQIINQTSNFEVEAIWDEGASQGKLCVYFMDFESCKSNEVCIDVDLLSSKNSDLAYSELIILPNLVDDQLLIQFNGHINEGVISIYHSAGQRVKTTKIKNTTELLILDVSEYNSGLYLVHFQTEDKTAVMKFFKK